MLHCVSGCGLGMTMTLSPIEPGSNVAIYGLGPWLAVVMMAVLSVRAAYGLSRYARHRKAMMIGVFEVIYGTVTVLAIVLGYRLGL